MDNRKDLDKAAQETALAARALGMADIYLAEDIRDLFGFGSLDAAREAITAGEFGPYSHSRGGDRLILRRVSVLAHLAAREVNPRPRGPHMILTGEKGPRAAGS